MQILIGLWYFIHIRLLMALCFYVFSSFNREIVVFSIKVNHFNYFECAFINGIFEKWF